MTEDQLTAECFQWAWAYRQPTRRFLFHVPNEGQRNPVRAGQLKAMGLVPGMMDFIFVQDRTYGIEMKLPGGKLSRAQEIVHGTWNLFGHPTFICYSLPGFCRLIDEITAGNTWTSQIHHYS